MAIDYGDELVTIVQIDQPFCTRVYGDGVGTSPPTGCQAQLGVTGSRKCSNTRITCQDPVNYLPDPLTLQFSRPQEGLEQYGYIIPSVDSVSITPLKINVGAMDRNVSPFGNRETVTVSFADHLHSDLLVDKYRLERLDGRAIEQGAAEEWNFTGTTDGWAATRGTLTAGADRVTLTATEFDSGMRGPIVSIDGSEHRFVIARIRQTVAGAWEGQCFYSTSGHGESSSFKKAIPIPAGLVVGGDFVTAIWDMHDLTAGGDDWATSTIERIRLDFSQAVDSEFEIDYVTVQPELQSYDPYERGTFWGKWLSRNPYHEGYPLRVYQGVVGQSLVEMEVRNYLISKINGPSDGSVTVTAKDLFAKVEKRKAKAPAASRGELASGILAGAGSATLAPAGIGDLEYPASGRVAIGDEITAFTRSGDVLTLTTRGDLNTEDQDHDAEDKVQLVLSYEGEEAQNIVSDLLQTFADIDPANIPQTDWDAEAAANFPNLYTAHITEPTPVEDLIGELAEQVGFNIWPEVTTNQIILEAIVQASVGSITQTVDDDSWIKAGTLSIKRMPDQRASQIWVYYGLINPLEDVDEKGNYRSRVITADLLSEGDTQYGSASVREVFSRWIPQFGRSSASDVGDRLLAIFRDPPFRASFGLFASREGLLSLADPFRLRVDEIQDDTGTPRLTIHLPIQISREEDAIRVESQQLQFFIQPGEGSPGAGEHELFIDNDTLDFNFRVEHDTLFSEAVSGDVVRVTIS